MVYAAEKAIEQWRELSLQIQLTKRLVYGKTYNQTKIVVSKGGGGPDGSKFCRHLP